MKKKKHVKIPVFNVGILSLLSVLILVSLITFAVLSLVSAKNDAALQSTNAKHISQYYDADNAARTILQTVDTQLLAARADATDEATYVTAAANQLTGIENCSLSGSLITITSSMNAKQALEVTLQLTYQPEDASQLYEIQGWKEVNTTSWENQQSLPLLKAE